VSGGTATPPPTARPGGVLRRGRRPRRSTGLLLALVGGIVALLVLIAREWIR
jgi:hypothetical protein